MLHSCMNVCIPHVINQGDMLGISQKQGQRFKQDILINTAITTTLMSRAVSQICTWIFK
jgi:hypothetical protein